MIGGSLAATAQRFQRTPGSPTPRTPRIGLVLGAGGVTGHAFHTGVLAALEEARGWDVRTADIVVGTSAGAVAGSLVRAGIAAADLFARSTGAPPSAEAAALFARVGPPPAGLTASVSSARAPVPSSPALLARYALRPWEFRAGKAAAAMLPRGTRPYEAIGDALRVLHGMTWPEAPFWVVAVRLHDGIRVVFGREGAPRTDVATAVAASAAIPWLFAPVPVDGVDHVDGGTHSPTNLDVLAGEDVDVVVVSSPLSTAGGPPRADAGMRAWSRFHLLREAALVRRAGAEVVAFEPDTAVMQAMGLNPMDPARRAPVARAAREAALARLARPEVRARLRPLTDA